VRAMAEEEIKDLDNIQPINYAVPAKPHTPVYKMHRYFARRPHNFFGELIRHYSNPGLIMLDAARRSGTAHPDAIQWNSSTRVPELHLPLRFRF